MVVFGLLLLAIGVIAGLAAVFSSSGTASFLGVDLGATTLFFLGVAATLAVLCGLMLTRAGTGRALRHRRELRRLRTVERERRRDAGGPGNDEPDGVDRTRQDPTT
ncbi:MAG TPA: hypothetical protein VH085_11685 [Nocardioides sp.]|jgi:uncharacterized integral membrane protein|nr:hypothetical protein [Nocardioides sp.]